MRYKTVLNRGDHHPKGRMGEGEFFQEECGPTLDDAQKLAYFVQ